MEKMVDLQQRGQRRSVGRSRREGRHPSLDRLVCATEQAQTQS